jgi:hypothetical protein
MGVTQDLVRWRTLMLAVLNVLVNKLCLKIRRFIYASNDIAVVYHVILVAFLNSLPPFPRRQICLCNKMERIYGSQDQHQIVYDGVRDNGLLW